MQLCFYSNFQVPFVGERLSRPSFLESLWSCFQLPLRFLFDRNPKAWWYFRFVLMLPPILSMFWSQLPISISGRRQWLPWSMDGPRGCHLRWLPMAHHMTDLFVWTLIVQQNKQMRLLKMLIFTGLFANIGVLQSSCEKNKCLSPFVYCNITLVLFRCMWNVVPLHHLCHVPAITIALLVFPLK